LIVSTITFLIFYHCNAACDELFAKLLSWSRNSNGSYAAFTHAGLTTWKRTYICIKLFLCCQVHALYEKARKPA